MNDERRIGAIEPQRLKQPVLRIEIVAIQDRDIFAARGLNPLIARQSGIAMLRMQDPGPSGQPFASLKVA
ncbi:hypothetical protein AWV79_15035 [Cupriavidus sp. UYMMa02A]|nr:hypothetical protein AWV79_15035 [Cupriavidus sp. UYMMa02A]